MTIRPYTGLAINVQEEDRAVTNSLRAQDRMDICPSEEGDMLSGRDVHLLRELPVKAKSGKAASGPDY